HGEMRISVAAQYSGNVVAVDHRQAEIEDDEVRALLMRDAQRVVAGRCGDNGEARPLQVVAEDAHDLGLVVDDQDGPHRGHHRRGTVEEPRSGPSTEGSDGRRAGADGAAARVVAVALAAVAAAARPPAAPRPARPTA